MKKTTKILVLAILIAALVFSGCSKKEVGEIKIYGCGAFSGPAAASGLEMWNSFKMAVDEVNAAGGIAGTPVQLIWGDDGGDASQGVTIAEKIVSDKAVYGVIGPNFSSVVETGQRIIADAGIAQITSAASRPSLTEKGYNNFFRVCSRDDDYGPAIGRYIAEELNVNSVYVLNNKDSHAQGLSDQVAETLSGLGVKTIYRDTIVAGAKDYSSILTRVKAANPDLVFVGATDAPDHVAMVMQMKELGINSIYFGSEGCKDQVDFIEASQGAAEGAYTYHSAPDIYATPSAAKYVADFQAQYGVLSGWGPNAYEAACVLLNAIKKAADEGNLSREAVRQNVADTQYTGIRGIPIAFNSQGDMQQRVTYIFQVQDGKFVQLKIVN